MQAGGGSPRGPWLVVAPNPDSDPDPEARAEWRRALACDPGLGMAQWALQKTGLG